MISYYLKLKVKYSILREINNLFIQMVYYSYTINIIVSTKVSLH